MFSENGVWKRFLIANIGLIRVVKCEESNDNKMATKCKPSELPFYKEYVPKPCTEQPTKEEPSFFEQNTTLVRKTVFNSYNTVSNYVNDVTSKVNLDHAKVWTNYLQEEENVVPRAGAIALGGISGLIFGLRGGLFRKLFYTTAGSLTMTSICYPNKAAEYSHIAVEDSKRYLTIAYNFVYGVKPGDPQKELPELPTIPSTFSEVWILTSDLSRSAKNMILGDQTSESKKEK